MASTIQSTYQSLLQGVSQQVPRLRLNGQLESQINMLSDPITSIRRRPALPYKAIHNFGDLSNDPLFVAYIERGVDGRHLVINTNTGGWFLLSDDLLTIVKSGQDKYFIAKNGRTSIHIASLDLNTFILNVEQFPETILDSSDKVDPETAGFIHVKAGGFQITYTATVESNGKSWTVTYTTPAASDSGAAARATSQYVAEQLATALTTAAGAELKVYTRNNVVGISQAKNITVSSGTNSSYLITSDVGRVNAIGDLSFLLPAELNGFMISVGVDSSALVWYRWDTAASTWLEDSSYGSIKTIINMPRQLTALDEMESNTFEGRLSGDESTNEDPAFINNGVITGISSYQGRLVLLSASFATLSKSNNPYRFYRSTVSDLRDDDRIDIGVGSQQNSVFRSAVQFNRDLILFGDSIQAVITGGNNVLTPKNAAITLTSELSCDSKVQAVPDGQTLLYPYKRSAKYSGLMELIPSSYTASQYISQDATAHIPQYIAGGIRMLSSSSATNMLALCSEDMNRVIIHEYQWSSEGKTQASWHTWEFSYSIVGLHFAQERLILLLNSNKDNSVYATFIDPREGFDDQMPYPIPYLDLYTTVQVVGGIFNVPEHLRTVDTNTICLCRADGQVIIEEVGIESINQTNWNGFVVLGTDDGEYFIGVRYTSSVTPTPPLLKDSNEKIMGAGAVRLVQMDMSVNQSGQFKASVVDKRTGVSFSMPLTSVYLNSFDIVHNEPSVGSGSGIRIPCSTNADTTYVTFSSNGVHDLNILDISYLLRYSFKHRRV